MADKYSVDDILAEVKQRRRQEEGAQLPQPRAGRRAPERTSAAPDAAPFRMTGMTGEFEPPAGRKSSRAEEGVPSDPMATRVDLPAQRPEGRRPAQRARDLGATQVIPAQRAGGEDRSLEQRRQEKVRQFLETPRPAFEEDEREDEGEDGEDGAIGSLSQFFGGLRRVGPAAAVDRKAPAPPERGRNRPVPRGEESPARERAREAKAGRRPAQAQERGERRAAPAVEGEYRSPAQAREVRGRILRDKRACSIRVILTGAGTGLLLYLSLCNLYPIPLLHPVCPEVDMRMFLLSHLILLLAVAIASAPALGNGIIGLFTGRANNDTPAALCTVAVIVHGMALILAEDGLHTGEGSFYFVIAAAALFANAAGRRSAAVRMERNFAVASADAGHVGDYLLTGRFAAELTEGQGFEEPAVAYPVAVDFPDDFIRLSRSDDAPEGFSRYLPYFFLLFSVLLGAISVLFFEQSGLGGLTIACATLCMASPLTALLVENTPLLRASRALSKAGAFVAGMESVEKFQEVNTVAVDANGLYPVGSVELHSIKSFAQSRIDEAILDAASLMVRVDGLLKDIFLEMIGGNTRILKQVDQVAYYDRAGLCAEIDGKTVLIGSRTLMEQFNISMPSKDYEKKFVRGDREILYLANSGEVTAMFVLSYRTSPAIERWLDVLARREISLVVQSTDPNITEARIAKDYGYPEEFIRIIPAKLRDKYLETVAPRKRGRAYVMSIGGFPVRMRALAALLTLRRSIMTETALQIAGLILGYALVAFLAFSGAVASLGFVQILIYQSFWAAAILIVSGLSRY